MDRRDPFGYPFIGYFYSQQYLEERRQYASKIAVENGAALGCSAHVS
jgi:hypothetical protein